MYTSVHTRQVFTQRESSRLMPSVCLLKTKIVYIIVYADECIHINDFRNGGHAVGVFLHGIYIEDTL